MNKIIDRRDVIEVRGLLVGGGLLTGNQVTLREKAAAVDPSGRRLRLELLGYYISKCMRWEFSPCGGGSGEPSDLALQNIAEHLLWFVKNEPNSPIFAWAPEVMAHLSTSLRLSILDGLEETWMRDTTRLDVLISLVVMSRGVDPERLIRVVDMLDISEPLKGSRAEVHSLLALRFLTYESLVREEKGSFLDDVATKDAASNKSITPWARVLCRFGMARESFQKGLLPQALEYARLLLQDLSMVEAPTPLLRHRIYTFLGLLALRNGDVQEAVVHLAESARPPFDGPLLSFGPEMDLVESLCDKGQYDESLSFYRTWEQVGCPDLQTRVRERIAAIQENQKEGLNGETAPGEAGRM